MLRHAYESLMLLSKRVCLFRVCIHKVAQPSPAERAEFHDEFRCQVYVNRHVNNPFLINKINAP